METVAKGSPYDIANVAHPTLVGQTLILLNLNLAKLNLNLAKPQSREAKP